MIKIFNSRFENSLRMVLLLSVYSTPEDIDRLYITDFITVYGKEFGISEENLNGDNDFKYSEFQTRKTACRNALRELVLNGLVIPIKDEKCIFYQITQAGRDFAEDLNSNYAVEYRKCALKAITYTNNYTGRQLIVLINKQSSDQLRGGSNE